MYNPFLLRPCSQPGPTNTYHLSYHMVLTLFSEIVWYNLCPTLSKDEIKNLATNYDPTHATLFIGTGAADVALKTNIGLNKCEQIVKLLVSSSSEQVL